MASSAGGVAGLVTSQRPTQEVQGKENVRNFNSGCKQIKEKAANQAAKIKDSSLHRE